MSDSEDNCSSPAASNKKQQPRNLATMRQSSLNDSLRKRNQQGPLNKAFITVQKEDGDIGTVEISVTDETFSTQQNVLQSLAEMGEISTPPPERKNKLKEAWRRGSLAVGVAPEPPKFTVPEKPDGARERSGSAILTPELLENLKRDEQRIVAKGGQCNIHLENVPKKRQNFVKDIFTTCVDMQWRYTFLAFGSSFFISWLIFTFLYMIPAYYRGDMEAWIPEKYDFKEGHTPCALICYDFTSYFLFSMESQHTIGYGSRQTTEQCWETIVIVCLQSIIGVMISATMAGIVFAKLARPKARSNTVMFSKNAVITQREGQLWLMFRLGNMRKSHLIESHLRAQLIHHRKTTKEGEILSYECEELPITTLTLKNEPDEDFATEDRTLFIFPTTVAHRIDENSPFYEWGPKDILNARFEMLVTLEGIVEPTGNSVQSRSSYLPNEILWGYHYENMVKYNNGRYVIDCSNLNAVIQNETPKMSRKNMENEDESLMTKNNDNPNHVSRVTIETRMTSIEDEGNVNDTSSD